MAIVAGAAALALGGAGARRRTRVAGTALVVVGFVVLARPEPSVLRAAVMGVVGLAGILLARPGSGVPALAGASVALLTVDPWLARSYGFVLSVLATAGLLLLVPVWLARSRLPRPLVLLVAVPLAAQAVTAPVVILLQPTVSLVAVPANILAAPAVAPATIAGVLAAGLSVEWPAGAHLAAIAGGVATSWLVMVAGRAAAVPGGSLPWPPGLGGAALLAALTAAAVTLSVLPTAARARLTHPFPPPPARAPSPGPPVAAAALPSGSSGRSAAAAGLSRWADDLRERFPGPPGGAARGRALGIGAVVVAVVAGWSAGPRLPLPGGTGDRVWTVVMCDVGQGDATLLRSGPGRAVLVDTGPDPGAVAACLERWDVRALDLVVLTHFHADHVAGLAAALDGRGRPPLLVSPCTEPAAQGREVRAAAARAGARVTVGAAGTAGRAGEVAWRLLWPDPGATCAADADGDEINDDSLVLVAEVGGVRAVLLGDVETEAQRALTARVPADGVDVVKVAHHGSAKQHPELYATMRPRVALIGVGRDNDYGHPAPSALDLLQRNGIRILRTDVDGDVVVLGPSARLAVATHPP